VTHDVSTTPARTPDASDVVDGPVGSAWLKDPATSGPTGGDLSALPPIDIAPDDLADDEGSIDGQPSLRELQNGEPVGVDRDLTRPPRGAADA
jgi:hypothetical protein